MRIDFSACSQFLAVLEEQAPLADALRHPAYQAVLQHAARFGSGITAQEVQDALQGAPSPFYGLQGIYQNLERIHGLLNEIQSQQSTWLDDAAREFARLLPGEPLEQVVIYPILGYDIGIGLQDTVCINLNARKYLEDPVEFFYFMLHEVVHVIYERSHPVPALGVVQTPGDWLAYFSLWLQNEGFAVYAPLRLRLERGHLQDRDYQVLQDRARLESSLSLFKSTWQALRPGSPAGDRTLEEYLEMVFGDARITYRAGCEIFRRIEAAEGLAGVRQAFALPAGEFLPACGAYLVDALPA